MNLPPTLFALLGFLTLGLAIASIASGRGRYESAKYKVLNQDGKHELRYYAELALVASPMAEDDTKGRDSSFMRLFGYISGENAQGAKIAMTTPVFVGPADGKVDTMSFVMPEAMTPSATPSPENESLIVTKWNAGTYASFRFSGRPHDKRETKALESLQAWITAQKLEVTGEPIFAYYDPPWTPGPMRRNEVLIPVKTP